MADPDERGGAQGPATGESAATPEPRKQRKPDTGLFGFDDELLEALEAEDDDELVLTGPSEPAPLSLGGLDLDDDLELGSAAELTDGIEPAEDSTPPAPIDTAPPFDSGIDAAFGASSPPEPLATMALGPVAVDAASEAQQATGVLANPVVPSPYGGDGESGILALDDIEELDEDDLEVLEDEARSTGAVPPPPPVPPAAADPAPPSEPASSPPPASPKPALEPVGEPASIETTGSEPLPDEAALRAGEPAAQLDSAPLAMASVAQSDQAQGDVASAEPDTDAGPPIEHREPAAGDQVEGPAAAPETVAGDETPVPEAVRGRVAVADERSAAQASGGEGGAGERVEAPSAPPQPALLIPEGPSSLIDPADAPAGLRLLVTLPPVVGASPSDVFPEHSPAAPDWSWGEGAGVATALPQPSSALATAADFDPLMALLRRTIEGAADPDRLASLCVGYGTIALRVYGDLDVALSAARAAVANAPVFAPGQRLLHEVHELRGEADERLALLERGDANALARAGHMAWRLGQAERALGDWGWAAEYDPAALGPMLSSLLALAQSPGLRDERAVLQWALARAQTPALWQALAVEQLRLNMRDEPDYADAWAEDGLQRLEPSASLGALVERHGLLRGHAGLIGAALALRPEADRGPDRPVAAAWVAEAAGDADAFARAVEQAHAAPVGTLGWLAARARLMGHRGAEAAALSAVATRVSSPEIAAAVARRLAALAATQGAAPAARAHLRAALSDDPTDVPTLALAGRIDGDPREAHARATAEVEALEARLNAAQGSERAALVSRLVDRYHRIIVALEGPLEAPAHAAAWAKRALALDPAGLDAVLVLERHLAQSGDWPRLAALALGWADRCQDPGERSSWLHVAGELYQHRLGSPAKALKVYQKILAETPADLVARAAVVDAALATGNWAAAAQAHRGLAERTPVEEQPVAFGVTGRLYELAGDAAGAFSAYQAALAVDGADPVAADGVVRLAAAGGDPAALVEVAEQPDAAHWEGLAAVQLADALLAADEVTAAQAYLARWRATHPEPDPRTEGDLRLMEGWLAERRGDWPAVVAALEAQAAEAEGATCANLWARVGEIAEVRLEDKPKALAAFEAALDADPANPAARDGFVRLGPAIEVGHAGGPWSQRARETPTLSDRQRVLAAEAQQLPAGPARDGMLTVAGQARGDSVEARAARSAAGGRARTSAVRAVAHAVASGDEASLAAGIEALEAEAPDSPLLVLASRRLAQLQADEGGADQALERLAEQLQSATWRGAALRARVHRHEASDGAEVSLEALEAAVLASPDDAERGQRLAERLIAAQAWARLEVLYDAQAGVASTFDERLALARARAGLRAERFDDPAGAHALLAPFLEGAPDDVDTALRAAQYAERAEAFEAADRCFLAAYAAEEGALRGALAHARALEARGEPEAALARLDEASERVGEDRGLLELQAEIRSRLRDWSGVVRTLLRLLEVEPTAAAKAHRAMAIGRILSRVVQDHRRAAGWFKRAVEFDADQLKAVWYMLAEVEKLPADQVPVDHIEDALHRAVEAVRVRLAASPSDPEVLQDLFRLQRARGDIEGARWTAEALRMLGVEDEKVRAALVERPRRRQSPVARDPQRVAWLLVHRRETRPAGALFALAAPALQAAIGKAPAGKPVDGAEVASGAWLEAWGVALGLEGLRVVEGDLSGGYDPRPVLRVPSRVLAGQGDAGDLFDVGCTLEGLRDGRLLATRLPVESLEAAVRTVAVSAGVVEAARPRSRPPEEDALRAATAATGIPAGPLATELERAGGSPDFSEFTEAVRASAHRAGLLVCEDLAAAVARVAALSDPAPTDYAVAVERDPAARALLLFALGPAHGALRRSLSLGEGA